MKGTILFFILGATLVTVIFFLGCASNSFLSALSEDSTYDFRKVRWGFSPERVELAEVGNQPIKRTEETLVYTAELNGVYCNLVYTFKNNRLRTAGYISKSPIPNADNIVDKAVKEHGLPNEQDDGMIWKTSNTVVYTKIYESVRRVSRTRQDYARDSSGNPTGGLLRDVVRNQISDQKPGSVSYLDGVLTYVDRKFFDDLHEMNFPLAELSFYEKQLMGIIERSKRTIIPGFGSVPGGVIR